MEKPPSQAQRIPENSHGDEHIPHISEAEERAFELLSSRHKELAIRPNVEEFAGEYGPEEIERDKNAVEKKKLKMERLESAFYKRAQLLEAILTEQIELSNWFGEGAMTIVPSEYDDLFNGIDLVTEFEEEDSFQYMAMGVDVTSSARQVEKKLDTIKLHIKDGTLTRVKYFRSERDDAQKRINNIPQLVIGADQRTINELANLWLTIHQARSQDGTLAKGEIESLRQKAKQAQEKLANHRAQVLILKQVQEQLSVFADYARKINLPNIEDKFRILLKIVNNILATKSTSPQQERANESDDVYRAIKNRLETFL